MSAGEPNEPRLFGRAALLVAILATLAASALFVTLPELDLMVARAFHEGGNGFLLRDTAVHRFVDAWIRPGLRNLTILLMALSTISLASRGRILGWPPRSIAYVALTFALGPGLLVNGLLKNFIGRARPKHIEALGGDRMFSAAYFPSDQCASNCAFVSGDVAVAFATIAFALLLSGPSRRIGVVLSLGLGALVGFYRMATGAHFLSDSVLAGLFCIVIALILHKIIFGRKDDPPKPA